MRTSSLKPCVFHLAFMVILLAPSLAAAVTLIDVWQYRITGVSRVDPALLQMAVAPFTGPARTVDDIDQAAAAVQEVYQRQGMQTVAVSVPEQDISGGVVTILVEETRIRRVRVIGSRYFSLDAVKEEVGSAKENAALNLRELQQDVQRINRKTGDLQVVPAVEPTQQPGWVDVDLNVTDKLPLHGGIEVTNYHSATTTPTRLALDARYGNLWQKYHELGFQYQTSPENTDEVKVGVLSYLAPLPADARLAAYFIKTDSDIATVNNIRVFGKGEIFGVRWVKPLVQKRSNVQSFSLGFDFKDFDEDTFTVNTLSTSAPIKYLAFSSLYSMQNNTASGSDAVSAGFTFGLRDLVNDADEFVAKRASADASFIYFKADWQRNYFLPHAWEFSHRLGGQIAESPLVSNEQFSAGGVSTVRGYYESQISGDSGVVANLELHTPDFISDVSRLSELDVYAFLDGAWVNTKNALPGEDGTDVISSVGLGTYALLFDKFAFQLDGGIALEPLEGSTELDANKQPIGVVGGISRGTFRARASLRYDF